MITSLHYCYVASHRAVEVRKLASYVSSTEDNQLLRQFLELQSLVACHVIYFVQAFNFRGHRPRAGSYYYLVSFNHFITDFQSSLADESCVFLEQCEVLASLYPFLDVLGAIADDLVSFPDYRLEINRDQSALDVELLGIPYCFSDISCVYYYLGRDASSIQASATHRPWLDNRDIQSLLSSCIRDIQSRTSSYYNDVKPLHIHLRNFSLL